MNATSSYESDFYDWTQQQAEMVRRGDVTIDREHIAEELHSLGSSTRRELRSRLTVLLTHLLEWEYQPERRSPSWRSTIRAQRTEISDLLDESPSLRAQANGTLFVEAFERAVLQASDEMQLLQPLRNLPPMTFEAAMTTEVDL